MKTFLIGTAICVLAAIALGVIIIFDCPRYWAAAPAILVLIGFFGFQIPALWRSQPQKPGEWIE